MQAASRDFTLAELQTLDAGERIPQNRPASAASNDRFVVPTLQAVIHLAQAGTRETGRTIAICPEIEYEGTSHFLITASSANIGMLESQTETTLKGEVP